MRERSRTRQALVQDEAQRENVAPAVDTSRTGLLGREILEVVPGAHEPAEPDVREDWAAIERDHDRARRNAAVDPFEWTVAPVRVLVQRLQTSCDLLNDRHGGTRIE